MCSLTQGCLLLFQYLSFSEVDDIFQSGFASVEPCIALLTDLRLTLYQSLAIAFVASLVICFIVLMIFTHRIAGPIYKFTQFLNEVADDPSKDRKVQFRKGDYFHELADAYNRKFETKK